MKYMQMEIYRQINCRKLPENLEESASVWYPRGDQVVHRGHQCTSDHPAMSMIVLSVHLQP